MDVNDPDLIEICKYLGKTEEHAHQIQEISRILDLEYSKVLNALNFLEDKHLGIVTHFSDKKFFQYDNPFWQFFSSDYLQKSVQIPTLNNLPVLILEADQSYLIHKVAEQILSNFDLLQSSTDIYELLHQQQKKHEIASLQLRKQRERFYEEVRHLSKEEIQERSYHLGAQVKLFGSKYKITVEMKILYEQMLKKLQGLLNQ